jgi:pimeloyl-ACP methyl ester carboxylesterase
MTELTPHTTMAERTGYAPSGRLKLFYRAFGRPGRTPVLIAHGMSYFSWDWIEIARALAAEREVVAFDQRGFGDSDWSPDRDYSPGAFAADMLAMLGHLGWKRAVLVGHSMGGRNSTFFAAGHPDRVAALALVDWSPQTAPAGSKRVRETTAGVPDAFASLDDAIRHFGRDPSDPRVRERYAAWLRPVSGGFGIKRDDFFRDRSRAAMQSGRAPGLVADGEKTDMWDRLARVACPILVVRGTRSDMFAAEAVPKVRAANPRLDLVEVDAGHDVGGDNPDALLATLGPFIVSY